jgi:hypothetical protein
LADVNFRPQLALLQVRRTHSLLPCSHPHGNWKRMNEDEYSSIEAVIYLLKYLTTCVIHVNSFWSMNVCDNVLRMKQDFISWIIWLQFSWKNRERQRKKENIRFEGTTLLNIEQQLKLNEFYDLKDQC